MGRTRFDGADDIAKAIDRGVAKLVAETVYFDEEPAPRLTKLKTSERHVYTYAAASLRIGDTLFEPIKPGDFAGGNPFAGATPGVFAPGHFSNRIPARPLCDQCGVPVDGFEEQTDQHMQRVRFTARCHGEVETVDVPFEEAKGISFGRAFVRGRKLAP